MAFAFSPDDQVIVNERALASSKVEDPLSLWSAQTGEHLGSLVGHDRFIYTVDYHPNGKIIASGGDDQVIRLWDADTHKNIRNLTGHTSTVRSLTYSPDGKHLASGSVNSELILWDTENNQAITYLLDGQKTDYVLDIEFSADGQQLAASTYDTELASGRIHVWDVARQEKLHTFAGSSALAFHPNGKTIATNNSADHSIVFWQLGDNANAIYRLLYDLDAKEAAGALKFIWQLERDGLDYKPFTYPKSLYPQANGYYIVFDEQTRHYEPLITQTPRPQDSKLDQVVRWLEARCAFKREADKQRCEAKK